ncbi:MAG: radical SAM protein [Deltaproteobacteria bacterium]|nr:radical SAM protein [Deltaproteobacteria bacterium]
MSTRQSYGKQRLTSGDKSKRLHYIRLKEGCVLIQGVARSALYDLSEGTVYSLNRSAHNVVAAIQHNIFKERRRTFVDQLIDMGIVESSDTPFPPRNVSQEAIPEATLEFIWLEVTSTCNLRCIHCYGDCLSSSGPDRVNAEGWKLILRQARDLGCSQVQFIGGEPLLQKDLFPLVGFARSTGYTFVEIFSNLTLFTQKRIPFLRDNGVHIATTLYSADPKTHDSITGVQGSHAKTVKAITLIKDNNVPVRVAVIAMKRNQHDLSATVEFLHEMGVEYKLPDPVRPTGRGCSQEIQPHDLPREFSGHMTAANFWTDRHSFFYNKRYNSCWAGKVAVTATGEVMPCIFARDLIVGNVCEENLKDSLQKKRLQELWGLTKDQVEVCQDCEYRYACHDCRPLAYAQRGNLYDKSPRCLYDPYRGRWQKK